MPTLVVGRTARTSKVHVAVSVTIAHAPTRDRHGTVAVGSRHCAVGGVVSQIARGAAGDLGRRRGEGRGGRVQLVGEGCVLEMWWWGIVKVGRVGRCFCSGLVGGCKGRHGSNANALWHRSTKGGSRGERIAGPETVRGRRIRGRRLISLLNLPREWRQTATRLHSAARKMVAYGGRWSSSLQRTPPRRW